MVVFAFMHYRAFPWWEFKYRKIPIDKVGYDYTGFGGIDQDQLNSQNNSPREQMEPDILEEFGFVDGGFMNNTDIAMPKPRRMKSSENMAIISKEMVTIKSWCSAFGEVLNVMDVCYDAKKNFVSATPSEFRMDSGRITPQKSYEYDQEETDLDCNVIRKNKSKHMLNAELLFDGKNNALNTNEKRQKQYVIETKQYKKNIELSNKFDLNKT